MRTRTLSNAHAELIRDFDMASIENVQYKPVHQKQDEPKGVASEYSLRLAAIIRILQTEMDGILEIVKSDFTVSSRLKLVEAAMEISQRLDYFRCLYFHDLASQCPDWHHAPIFTLRDTNTIVVHTPLWTEYRAIVIATPFLPNAEREFMHRLALSPLA